MNDKYLRLANAILRLIQRGKQAGPDADGKSPKRHFRVLYHRLAAARPGK